MYKEFQRMLNTLIVCILNVSNKLHSFKGYTSQEAPDQRSPAPDRLGELLTVAPHKQAALDLPDGPQGPTRGSPASRLKEREKHLKRRSKVLNTNCVVYYLLDG